MLPFKARNSLRRATLTRLDGAGVRKYVVGGVSGMVGAALGYHSLHHTQPSVHQAEVFAHQGVQDL